VSDVTFIKISFIALAREISSPEVGACCVRAARAASVSLENWPIFANVDFNAFPCLFSESW